MNRQSDQATQTTRRNGEQVAMTMAMQETQRNDETKPWATEMGQK